MILFHDRIIHFLSTQTGWQHSLPLPERTSSLLGDSKSVATSVIEPKATALTSVSRARLSDCKNILRRLPTTELPGIVTNILEWSLKVPELEERVCARLMASQKFVSKFFVSSDRSQVVLHFQKLKESRQRKDRAKHAQCKAALSHLSIRKIACIVGCPQGRVQRALKSIPTSTRLK